MRIIAGEFRGRVILSPKSDQTRPITDRVKQSLFDILTPAVAEANVFDVFAGTGSLGLEALSRGARHATFFESDPSPAALLRKNIETLKVQSRSAVVAADLFAWFARAERKEEWADLVFLDPPYRYLTERSSELQSLANNIRDRLAPDGQVIFRHDVRDSLELPGLSAFDVRDYGSMRLEFLRAPV